MRLTVLPIAELEASEAALWYDQQRIGLGDAFIAEMLLAFERVAQEPHVPAKLESYEGSRELRRYSLKRFPYLVVFECRNDEVLVVAVAHVRRKPLYWLDRLDD